jgi:aspartokinase
MKNIVGEVWKYLDNNPSIKADISLGIINIRALAKYIIKTQKMDVTLDAVISAIRRYEINRQEDLFGKARKVIRETFTLSTRSGLIEISLVKDDDVQRILPELFEIIDYARGEVLRVIQATECIKLLADEKNLEKVSNVFPKEKILRIEKNIAEINMHMHPNGAATRGILAVITNELAINGISIFEIMSCLPEMLLFVKEEDILKSYQVLYELCRH